MKTDFRKNVLKKTDKKQNINSELLYNLINALTNINPKNQL